MRGWQPEMSAWFGEAHALREVVDLDLEEAFVELLRSARNPRRAGATDVSSRADGASGGRAGSRCSCWLGSRSSCRCCASAGAGTDSDPWASWDLLRRRGAVGCGVPGHRAGGRVGAGRRARGGRTTGASTCMPYASRGAIPILVSATAPASSSCGIGAALGSGTAGHRPRRAPPVLHAYPGGLTLRFWLAGLMAYTMMFALSGLTNAWRRSSVAGCFVLVIVTVAASCSGWAWNPIGWVADALFGPYGPLAYSGSAGCWSMYSRRRSSSSAWRSWGPVLRRPRTVPPRFSG